MKLLCLVICFYFSFFVLSCGKDTNSSLSPTNDLESSSGMVSSETDISSSSLSSGENLSSELSSSQSSAEELSSDVLSSLSSEVASSDNNSTVSSSSEMSTTFSGYFPQSTIWYQDRYDDPVHSNSDAIINWMAQDGNSFQPNNEFRIDLSLTILETDTETEFRTFTKTSDFYDSDCDYGSIPVPENGSIEGEEGYECTSDGDCHLLVVDRESSLLFEMWRADISGGEYNGTTFNGGCMVVWDMKREYGWNLDNGLDYEKMGRGNECTSADAAGYPITPLLFTSDELAQGEIKHALRFILPNKNIRQRIYVAPSTHSTGPTSAGDFAPPYGAHLRLKRDAELLAAHPGLSLDDLPKGARAIVTALQHYGMFLSDGGSIALTGASDKYSDKKYCDHDTYEWCDEDPNRLLHEHDLKWIRASDFEVLDNGGPERYWEGNCSLLYSYVDETREVVER